LSPSFNLIDHRKPPTSIDTFKTLMLKKAYERIQKLGDRLAKIELS